MQAYPQMPAKQHQPVRLCESFSQLDVPQLRAPHTDRLCKSCACRPVVMAAAGQADELRRAAQAKWQRARPEVERLVEVPVAHTRVHQRRDLQHFAQRPLRRCGAPTGNNVIKTQQENAISAHRPSAAHPTPCKPVALGYRRVRELLGDISRSHFGAEQLRNEKRDKQLKIRRHEQGSNLCAFPQQISSLSP